VPAAMPVPMVDLLHFCLSIFVKGLDLWGLEFIENAVSGAWNTRHCVDWADSACKRRRPGNAEHCSQEGSPIHSKPPKVACAKKRPCPSRSSAR